jgi:hypothetical protein
MPTYLGNLVPRYVRISGCIYENIETPKHDKCDIRSGYLITIPKQACCMKRSKSDEAVWARYRSSDIEKFQEFSKV